MVRSFGTAGLTALIFGATLLLGSARADAPEDIRAVISGQIAAFAAGDAQRAFDYATPKIQSQFGSSEVFISMVEGAYGALIRPKRFDIQDVRADGDQGAARAYVVGADGRAFVAIYPLKRQPDGQWRIDGCFMEAAPGRSL